MMKNKNKQETQDLTWKTPPTRRGETTGQPDITISKEIANAGVLQLIDLSRAVAYKRYI